MAHVDHSIDITLFVNRDRERLILLRTIGNIRSFFRRQTKNRKPIRAKHESDKAFFVKRVSVILCFIYDL